MENTGAKIQIASILFDYITGNDIFLASLVEAATETLGVVSQARLRSEPNLASLRELKATWINLATSKQFLIPGKQRSDLKRLCFLVLVDLPSLAASPSLETLDTASVLLREIIEKAERLLHGDPSKLVKAALNSTNAFLLEIERSVPARQYGIDKGNPSPINLWAECRRLSLNTNPVLYRHADRILHYCSQLTQLHQLELRHDPVVTRSTRLDTIASLQVEIQLLQAYFHRQRMRAAVLCASRALLPVFFVALCLIPFGLVDFNSISKRSSEEGRSSDGDKVLTPDGDDYMKQWPPSCRERYSIKEEAAQVFSETSPNRHKAISLMREYLSHCPDDAEAQIYLNNYQALVAKSSPRSRRPISKLAVVVPLLRKNGVRDSYEILRGIGLAQDMQNRQPETTSHAEPLLLVQIHNDGLAPPGNHTKEKISGLARKTAFSVVSFANKGQSSPPVVGVIGHFSSDSTEAASRIYNHYHMPVVSPTSTNLREPLSSPRYFFAPNPILVNLLSFLPAHFADNLLSNYERLRHRIQPEADRLDLDPNVFRMAPTDEDAQLSFLEYLRRYNARTDNPVGKLVVISEPKGGNEYPYNYLKSLSRLTSRTNGGALDIVHAPCTFYPFSSRMIEPEKCRSEILRDPGKPKALIVVASSYTVDETIAFVKGVIKSHPVRKNLIVIGADSLMSTYLTNKNPDLSILSGTIITSASRERKDFFPLGFLPVPPLVRKPIRLTWRTEMSRHSVELYASVLKNAFKAGFRERDASGLRGYLISNIAQPVDSDSVAEPRSFRFHSGTHDRNVGNNSSLNMLLCAVKGSSGALEFRDIDSLKDRFCEP